MKRYVFRSCFLYNSLHDLGTFLIKKRVANLKKKRERDVEEEEEFFPRLFLRSSLIDIEEQNIQFFIAMNRQTSE